ncbi:hypothetical protein [Acinetobacter sp. YH01009]|uniref:hypothetical protein n=1 Tax=Acinetobacter sp. YH01009 TaxID=2601025 RepID=UPI0015D31A3C|nr:hypothetical protein [Acinetobacter sp. YH01009]
MCGNSTDGSSPHIFQVNFLSAIRVISRIKKTLIYLLHDESVSLPKRIADCIFDPKYKLNEFGQSNIQELVGWVNSEGKPVINGRTTKVLRYFGFNVRQIS